jgi:hypothetical protein
VVERNFAFDEGAAAERTAIVAWLREEAVSFAKHGVTLISGFCSCTADAIERGGHASGAANDPA